MEKELPEKNKILFLEDDQILRNAASRFLKRSGYKVELAQDGDEAVELYKKADDSGIPFSAVVLDLTIPGGMGGKETFTKLREINPHVKAIVSSGYPNDPVITNFREHGFRARVVKPYTIQDLGTAVRGVLGKNL